MQDARSAVKPGQPACRNLNFGQAWNMSLRLLTWAAALGASASLLADATNRFGFSGPEVFPLDYGIGLLHVADLDGDGLNDLIVVNNNRSKLTLLYNRTGKTNAPVTPAKIGRKDINELPSDARFRVDSISSEKRITSLVVADLNGDGRPDLAYYGDPRELVIQYNLGTNGWATPKRWPLDDGILDSNALTVGDINADGRPDLLLLAEKHIYVLPALSDGSLGEPEKIPYSGTVKALQVLDLDGDGRDDLMMVNWDHPNPFRFRLQIAPHQFGPEIHLPFVPVRSYWADDLDGDHVTEIITIAAKSGRAAIGHIAQKAPESFTSDLKDGQFSVVALPRTDKGRRGVLWTDLNGDGRPDLVVADPEGGQLNVQLQQPNGVLAPVQSFPTLTGVTEIVAGDWDGDGRNELFLLSGDEKQVGVTSLGVSGRIDFPKPITLPDRPLAIAVGILRPGEKPRFAAITERDEKKPGKDGKDETTTVRELVLLDSEGKTVVQRLSAAFKGTPTRLSILDADQDGLNDLVVLTPYEKIKVLVQLKEIRDGASFTEVDVNPPGGTTDNPWLATADVDGDGKPELLLAQKNYLRAVVLASDGKEKPTWNFTVRDQINGASSSSRLTGVAAISQGEGKPPVLFLMDAERKALTVSTRDASGVWKAGKSSVLPVTDFTSLVPLSLGADKPNAVGFQGLNSVAWKKLSGDIWELNELDGYETPIKDGYLHDITSGDLNHDGRKDLVFLETARNYVDLVAYESPHQLVAANRWAVFEERSYRNRRSELSEPREAIVVDVTGDGRNDLILVVHDRILLYPQE